MATAKVTWYFHQGGLGWTVSLWRTIGGGGLGPVLNTGLFTADIMLQMCGAQTQMNGIRVSDESVKGDSLVQIIAKAGNGLRGSDVAKVALGMKMINVGQQRKKHIFFRGVWDDAIVGGIFDPDNAAWVQRFNTFKNHVVNSGYGWMGVFNNRVANVINYAVQPAGNTILLTFDGNVFDVPDLNKRFSVRLSGINGKSILNGQQVVICKGQNSAETVKAFGAGPFRTPGKVNRPIKDFIPCADLVVTKAGERKTGTPFLVTPGRAKNRPTI